MRSRVLGTVALCALAFACRAAWAQDAEPEFIPDEHAVKITGQGHFLSIGEVGVISAVLGAVPVALIFAMGFMSNHRYQFARSWAYGALAIAGVQGLGAMFILWSFVTDEIAVWHDMSVNDLDFLFLSGSSVIGIIWSRWIIRTTRVREADPKGFLAGSRVGTS